MKEQQHMVYTAIYQTHDGGFTSTKYMGYVNRREAWIAASDLGEHEGNQLIALIPGDHPVYFEADAQLSIKDIDVFDNNIRSDSSVG